MNLIKKENIFKILCVIFILLITLYFLHLCKPAIKTISKKVVKENEQNFDSIEIAMPLRQNNDTNEFNDSVVEIEQHIKKVNIEKILYKPKFIAMDSVLSMVFVEGGKLKKPLYTRIVGKIPDTVMLETYNYFIGKYEVTTKLYYQFTLTKKNKEVESQFPFYDVTMPKVIEFCNSLNKIANLPDSYDKEGNLLDDNGLITKDTRKVRGYRLPTTSEWEFAARGGRASKHYLYSGSNNPYEVGWFENECRSKDGNILLHFVGLKKPNELGIYDMTGNASELCNDICPKNGRAYPESKYPTTWKLRVECGDPFQDRGDFDCYYCNYEMSISNENLYFINTQKGFRIVRSE